MPPEKQKLKRPSISAQNVEIRRKDPVQIITEFDKSQLKTKFLCTRAIDELKSVHGRRPN